MRIGRFFTLDRAAITAITVIAIDQFTKWWSVEATTRGETINILPGVSIGQTRNEGIAFGLFAGRPYLVFGLMGVALTVLVVSYVKHRRRPVLWLATGLLLGGAIGNAIDRITLGYVRDFIEIPNFPSFNLADVAITAGVVILVLAVEQRKPQDETGDEKSSEPEPAAEQND